MDTNNLQDADGLRDATPDGARRALERGNARFLDELAASGSPTPEHFEGLVSNGQHPIAVVLTCSDSRVQPVLSFGMHMGDLFVVRAIGGFVGEVEEASIEYGVGHLGAPLVVVLGHTHCGLVKAALDGDAEGAVGAVAARVAVSLHGVRDPARRSASTCAPRSSTCCATPWSPNASPPARSRCAAPSTTSPRAGWSGCRGCAPPGAAREGAVDHGR